MLIPKGRWTTEAAEALHDPAVDGLSLSYTDGFAELDLEFLDAWPIQVLVVLDHKLCDLRPVERLAGTLEGLFVDAADGAVVDLTGFERLRKLEADWIHVAENISGARNLQEVILWPYGGADLEPLVENVYLERVTLKDSRSLESLSGVERLDRLEELAVLRAPFLRDTADLLSVRAPLRELNIQDAMGVEALNELVELSEVSWLGVGDCGAIESLKPLEALRNLERLHAWGTTRILDNDLSPLTRLPKLKELRMRSRREYRPQVTEIKEFLAARGV